MLTIKGSATILDSVNAPDTVVPEQVDEVVQEPVPDPAAADPPQPVEIGSSPPLPHDSDLPVGYHRDGVPIHPKEAEMVSMGMTPVRPWKNTSRPPWILLGLWSDYMWKRTRDEASKDIKIG